MKQGFKGIVLTTTICAGLLCASVARAAHATNFLDALHAEITNRIANLGTNATAAERRALSSAASALERNTKSFSADLSALATVANIWEARLTNGATLNALGNDALASYSAEAGAQLDLAELHLGTNSISKGLSNQLDNARLALTNADANTNGVAARARALAQAFNKLRTPVAKILKKFPTVPFEAPTDIATGRNILLSEDAVVTEQTKFYFHTVDDMLQRYLWYTSDNPAEVGVYIYERLSPTTAVLHCTVTLSEVPGGSTAPHDMLLIFTSATSGTFTGRNTLLENLQGHFTID